MLLVIIEDMEQERIAGGLLKHPEVFKHLPDGLGIPVIVIHKRLEDRGVVFQVFKARLLRVAILLEEGYKALVHLIPIYGRTRFEYQVL